MQQTRFSGHYEEVRLVSLELGGDPRKVSPRLLDRPPVALKQIGLNFEAIAVNNASRLSGRDGRPTRAKVIDFRRNFGQTAVLMARIDRAKWDPLLTRRPSE